VVVPHEQSSTYRRPMLTKPRIHNLLLRRMRLLGNPPPSGSIAKDWSHQRGAGLSGYSSRMATPPFLGVSGDCLTVVTPTRML